MFVAFIFFESITIYYNFYFNKQKNQSFNLFFNQITNHLSFFIDLKSEFYYNKFIQQSRAYLSFQGKFKTANLMKNIAIFWVFILALSQSQIISVQQQNNSTIKTISNSSPQNLSQWESNLYYKHFDKLFGSLFMQSVIAFEENDVNNLRALQNLRVSNNKAIKSYFTQFTPKVLKELDDSNLWTSLPLTNLPYFILSKLHNTIQNEKSIFSDFGIENPILAMNVFTEALIKNKQLIKSLSLQLRLQGQLRSCLESHLLANHDKTVQKYYQIFSKLASPGMISDQFLSQFGLSNSENSTKKTKLVQNQLEALFGKPIIDEFIIRNPQKEQKFKAFDNKRNQIQKWFEDNKEKFQKSQLKLNWQSQHSNSQQLLNPNNQIYDQKFQSIIDLRDFINFRKVYDYERGKVLRKDLKFEEFTNFTLTFADFNVRATYFVEQLYQQWSQIYEDVRQFWRNKQLAIVYGLQTISTINSNKSAASVENNAQNQSCTQQYIANYGRTFKLSNNLYYCDRKITWDELKKYSLTPKNSLIPLKAADYYFQQSQTIFSQVKLFPAVLQPRYKNFLTSSGISDQQFKSISQKGYFYNQVKLYRGQDEVIYDCNHFVFIKNQENKTTILLV